MPSSRRRTGIRSGLPSDDVAPSNQLIGSITDADIDLGEVGRRDAIRGHNVDRVAEWAQQEVSATEQGLKRTDVGEVAPVGYCQIKCGDGAEPANALEARVGAKWSNSFFLHCRD